MINPNTKFQLKNIQTAPSRNGFSLIADLYINDRWTLTIDDRGDGSYPNIVVHDRWMNYQMEEILKELPEVYFPAFDHFIKIDMGLFIDLLHASIVEKREFKILELNEKNPTHV